MDFNEFKELAKKRESCRDYDPDREVEIEKIEACLETMKLAPSACNAQPYYYYIVRGDDAKNISKYFQLGKMNSLYKGCICLCHCHRRKLQLVRQDWLKRKESRLQVH